MKKDTEKSAEKRGCGGRREKRRAGRPAGAFMGSPLYAVGALGLAVLVAGAFFLPRILFDIGDGRLCRDVVLGEREEMDLTFLSEAYEMSLRKRLSNFAEGLERSCTYYVSSQEMERNEETMSLLRETLTRFLDSYEPMSYIEEGLILSDLYIAADETYPWELREWKQYVIYSDDYSGGVNFIIWYIQAENLLSGKSYHLLLDSESGIFYGACVEMGPEENDIIRESYLYETLSTRYPQDELWKNWIRMGLYYQYIQSEEADEIYSKVAFYFMDRYGYDERRSKAYIYDGSKYTAAEDTAEDTAQDDPQMAPALNTLNGEWNHDNIYAFGYNSCTFRMPYGDQTLGFSIRYLPAEADGQGCILYMGIDAIGQLIPEFANVF